MTPSPGKAANRETVRRRIVSTVAVVCLLATMAGALTSVGFEETADLADLLAYRLDRLLR